MAQRPRLLFLDIETSLLAVYTFGIRDQHIQHTAIADDKDGKLIHMVGMKWQGKRPQVLTEWEHGFEGMLRATRDAITEADAVITYNGARFDIPKIRGACLLAGLEPPPPPTQIDLFKTARGLGFVSSKLDYVADRLGLGSKVKHDGFSMWVDVFNGCPKARAKMTRYCAGDVNLTERVYDKLRPYILQHPFMAEVKRDQCGACGSSRLIAQGTRRTKAFVYQRLQCQCCGSWSQGRREAA